MYDDSVFHHQASSTIVIIPMINQLPGYCLLCPCLLKLPTQFNRPYHNYTIINIQSNHHFGRSIAIQ